MRLGGRFVVVGAGFEASVEDADEPVAELADGGVVVGLAGPLSMSSVPVPGNDDGLFVEGVVDQPGDHARGLGPDEFDESAAAGFEDGVHAGRAVDPAGGGDGSSSPT